jgi:hypothetical protein
MDTSNKINIKYCEIQVKYLSSIHYSVKLFIFIMGRSKVRALGFCSYVEPLLDLDTNIFFSDNQAKISDNQQN